MDNLSEQISSFLSQPDAMAQIEAMAKQLGLGEVIGPMIEEKYGTINLLIMMLITAGITGIINSLFSNKKILGASGIVFMLIVLSSFVNLEAGKIPITLILIFIFYIVNEIIDGLFKNDKVSQLGHLIGAVCGFIFGFYWM